MDDRRSSPLRESAITDIAGAILCGHDYDWPGVRQAVGELLPGHQLVPETSIWWVVTNV